MKTVQEFYKKNKKAVVSGAVVIIAAVIIGIVYFVNREQVSLLATDYDVEVNTELSTDISKYLDGVKNPDQVTADWEKVDTKKVGDYDVSMVYKGTTYVVHFHVNDIENPKLEISKKEFTFSTDTSAEEINQAINKCIKITDNYDKEFKAVSVVSKVPDEAKEETYQISVKDTSGNESEKVQIKITYTEAKQEESVQTASQGSAGNQYVSQGSGNSSSSAQSGTSAPSAPSQEDIRNQYGDYERISENGRLVSKLYATYNEGMGWVKNHIADPDSEWYLNGGSCHQIETGEWQCYILP